MTKKKVLRILVPAIMLVAVVGIWLFQANADQANEEAVASSNLEYPLNVTGVDLEVLKESGLPIIVDFGADECIPCKEMAPVLVTLNEEMQGKAIVQFVDVWKSPEAASGFPVQVIPTQIIVNSDGTPYVPSEEVANEIAFSLYANSETEEHVFTAHQGGLTEEQMRLILSDMGVDP